MTETPAEEVFVTLWNGVSGKLVRTPTGEWVIVGEELQRAADMGMLSEPSAPPVVA